LLLPNAPVLGRELSRAFVLRAMRSARALASAWTFAIVLRIRARAAALRLVLAIFLQSSSTLADAIAYEQERTWERTAGRQLSWLREARGVGVRHSKGFSIDTKSSEASI